MSDWEWAVPNDTPSQPVHCASTPKEMVFPAMFQ